MTIQQGLPVFIDLTRFGRIVSGQVNNIPVDETRIKASVDSYVDFYFLRNGRIVSLDINSQFRFACKIPGQPSGIPILQELDASFQRVEDSATGVVFYRMTLETGRPEMRALLDLADGDATDDAVEVPLDAELLWVENGRKFRTLSGWQVIVENNLIRESSDVDPQPATPTYPDPTLIVTGPELYDPLTGKIRVELVPGLVPDISDMIGATDSSDGEAGLVPAPLAGDESKFLKGDGSWADVPSVDWSDIVGKPETFPPGGGAGGVLSGTFPNPGFAVNMATQAELEAAVAAILALRGAADGLAPLGGDLRVPIENLPASVLGNPAFRGLWNATTNTPAIPAADSSDPDTTGWFYIVAVAGSTEIDGEDVWGLGDFLYSNGTVWEKLPASGATVISVAGKTGVVLLDSSDVGLGDVDNTADMDKPVSTAQAAAIAAASTNDRARANHTGTQLAATISDFNSAAASAAPVQSVAGRTGVVTLAKADVGLSNVDDVKQQVARLTFEDVLAGTYSFILADEMKVKFFNRATAQTITIPTNASVAFPVGGHIWGRRVGAGEVTISPASGVTLNGSGSSYLLGDVGTWVKFIKVGTDAWETLRFKASGGGGGGVDFVFTSTLDGLVPAPITPAGKFLKDDATWAEAGAALGLQTIWIPGGALANPEGSPGVETVELTGAANVVVTRAIMPDDSLNFSYFQLAMPRSWNRGDVQVRLLWGSENAAGNIVFQARAASFGAGDLLTDGAAWGTALVFDAIDGSDAADKIQTTPWELMELGADPQPDDFQTIRLFRNYVDAADTFTGIAWIYGIQIRYMQSAANDDDSAS